MYFLLTRPEQHCRKLARELVARGHQVARAPLLAIHHYDLEEINLSHFQAVLFTSANGVDALARNSPNRNIACFAVGAATAQRATEAGFNKVFTANGNVDRLGELVIENLTPDGGPLLHISGRDIAGNLSSVLGKAGFHLSRKQLYRAERATRLPAQAHTLITSGRISHIPLYSPRSAKILEGLIRSADLDHALSRITVLCLGPAVANMVKSLHWHEILTASQPDQDSLFRLVKINLEENRQ